MSEEDKRVYLEFAKQVAREAGEIMRKYFSVTDTVWKGDNTPVTQADTEINAMVIERIQAKYPDHSVLGEEQSISTGSRYTWVCDPVDGTMPYSHGLPISTFSLALCVNGVLVVGVVYDPFMDRLFHASSESGAYCNDKKISVNAQPMQNALIDVSGFPATQPVLDIDSRVMSAMFAAGARVTSLWSCILPSCLVAAGKYEGVVLNLSSPHDPAAIKLIVEEAGGRVTDLYGCDQRYDRPTQGFIASNGVIHDELVKIIQEAT